MIERILMYLFFGIALVPLVILYFLPAIVADGKRHAMPIKIVNLLVGWTGIGWLGVLLWALMSPGKTKRLGMFLAIFFVLIVSLVMVRAKLIYMEAPKVVALIKEYKADHGTYPESRRDLPIKHRYLLPDYLYDKENDEFSLCYSLFAFYRLYYDSKRDVWGHLD